MKWSEECVVEKRRIYIVCIGRTSSQDRRNYAARTPSLEFWDNISGHGDFSPILEKGCESNRCGKVMVEWQSCFKIFKYLYTSLLTFSHVRTTRPPYPESVLCAHKKMWSDNHEASYGHKTDRPWLKRAPVIDLKPIRRRMFIWLSGRSSCQALQPQHLLSKTLFVRTYTTCQRCSPKRHLLYDQRFVQMFFKVMFWARCKGV